MIQPASILCRTGSIVDYANHVAPLLDKFEQAFDGRSRKQRFAESIILTWTDDERTLYAHFLEHLASSAKVAFPDSSATVCLSTDASDYGWSLVVTQVRGWQPKTQVHEQAHELLICKGGTFKGAQLDWSIVEKEAYPIIKAAKDLEGADLMIMQLRDKYDISSLAATVKEFVPNYLLCKHVKGGLIIQRPWSETRDSAGRNEVLHIDFLYMGGSDGTTCYVLVLKDELAHYCELVACDSPTSTVTAMAVLDWAKRIGLPVMWISDNGSHFKNTLLEELRDRMKAVHTFVPVYTPWVNGTVECLNRDVLQVMRESEPDPVRSLGDKAPVELFTGLHVPPPLDAIQLPKEGRRKGKLMMINLDAFDVELERLRTSLQEMYAEATDRKERTRMYQSMAKKGKIENFSVVTEALPYSFMVCHLITGEVFEVHEYRLKFYDNASFEVTNEVLEHVGKQGIVTAVREIRDHRYNRAAKQWELLVSWRGLQEIEGLWELLSSLKREIPVMVQPSHR
ncbi:hypothetical protein ATCC90586_009182 [Pythium insidiosum]|nr:hypothetical protein ATCC90586_009182 [Pythium insidiosum]